MIKDKASIQPVKTTERLVLIVIHLMEQVQFIYKTLNVLTVISLELLVLIKFMEWEHHPAGITTALDCKI